MNNKQIIFFATMLAVIAASFFLFFTHKLPIKTKPLIVCTTTMITDTVKNIAGNLVTVEGLMGPGVDPHLYRARQTDVYRLAKADVIFYNGLHLEGKMAEIFGKLDVAVALGSALDKNELRPSEFAGIPDPHIWFDVLLWSKTIPLIRDSLIKIDVKNASIYTKNATKYMQKLRNLDAYIQKQASLLTEEKRVLITAHDAFGYFGKAYGFKVVGLQGISTESEPGARDIQNLARFIVDNNIKAIFTESSIPQRNIEAVQNAVIALDHNVIIGDELYSDALGTPNTKTGTYIGMVQHNLNVIVKSLL